MKQGIKGKGPGNRPTPRELKDAGYKAYLDGLPCEAPTTRELDRGAWVQGWRAGQHDHPYLRTPDPNPLDDPQPQPFKSWPELVKDMAARPHVYRLSNLDTGTVYAFTMREGYLIPVVEVTPK